MTPVLFTAYGIAETLTSKWGFAAVCGVLLCATQMKAPLRLCHKTFGTENDRFRHATQTV